MPTRLMTPEIVELAFITVQTYLKFRTDLATLPETIVAEIKLNRKQIFFVLSY